MPDVPPSGSLRSPSPPSGGGVLPYLCSSCGARFDLGPEEPERCPRCLRASGLVRRSAEDRRRRGPLFWSLAAIGVLGAAGVAAWAAGSFDPKPPGGAVGGSGPSGSEAPPATSPATTEALLASVPEALRLAPDAVTGAVRLAAEPLPRDPAAIVAAVAAARKEGRLPARALDLDLREAPRTASAFAPALEGKEAPAAGSLELGILAHAALEAKGFAGAAYGIDDSGPGGATDLQGRRYLVRVESGPWLAPDGAPVDPAKVRPLDAAGFLADVLAWRALGAMAETDADLASKAVQQARVLAPDDVAIAFTAGQVQVANGLAEMGLSAMEGAAAKKSDARTWHVLGVTAMGIDQPFKAHQYLVRSAEMDPKRVEPHVLLAQLDLERVQLTPKPKQEEVLAEVRAHLEAARAVDPAAPGLPAIEAQLAALDGDLAKAESILAGAVKAHPADADAVLVLSQFLEASGRLQEARDRLQEAADRGVSDPDVFHRLGVLHAVDGRVAEAEAALSKALALRPESAELRPQLAQIRKALGKTDEARGLLEEHLEAHADDAETRLLLAQLELDAGRPAEAAKQVAAVLLADPQNPEAVVLRYLVTLRDGTDPAGAAKAKEEAIRVLGAASSLAQVLLEQGFFEEGEKLLHETVVADPQDELAPALLAAVLVARGRKGEAEKLRDEALAKVGDEAERAALREKFDAAISEAEKARSEMGEPPPAPGDAPPETVGE